MRLRDGAVADAASSRHLNAGWLAAAGILLAATVAVKAYQQRRPPVLPDLVNWVAAEDAPELARKQGKQVFYFFTATWCGPCKVVKKDVFSVRKHAEAIEEAVVPVAVYDADKSPAAEVLRKRFGIRAYPTFVLAAPGSKKFRTYDKGARTGEALLEWMRGGAG